MATQMIEKFIDKLATIIKEPPYLLFIFISGVFVAITLITQNNFDIMWKFFLYSVAGTMWRYAEKDIQGIDKGNKKLNSILRIIYHIGNIGLFLIILYYLY